jgi:hypothetical protein
MLQGMFGEFKFDTECSVQHTDSKLIWSISVHVPKLKHDVDKVQLLSGYFNPITVQTSRVHKATRIILTR